MLEKEPKQGKKFQYLRIYNLEQIWSRIHQVFGPEFTWSRKYLVPNSPVGPEFMRIKNDLEFQIGRYQSRATCFDIILTEALAEVWMSKHVAQDWYLPIWNERSFLILFLAEYWQ